MAKNWNFGVPLGVPSPKRESVCRTDMYNHSEFHVDRCHRRRDICNRTEKKQRT